MIYRPVGRLLGALALLLTALPAAAQSPCLAAPATTAVWAPPLDRPVTLRATEISLRDALARISADAGVRLTYSADVLPLDRRVCARLEGIAAGDALTALLGSLPVSPLVVGSEQVVLAPSRPSSVEVEPTRVIPLEKIVVTGSASGAAERSLAISLDVIEGDDIRLLGGDLSSAIAASAPGMWAWISTPTSLLARYGSIRGASSFGASYPKVYIDGIEVANPLVVAQLDAGAVERVEVIRGPQGAALYGTDAISGVVNIVTRHDPAGGGSPDFSVRSDVGFAATQFGNTPSLMQQHGLALSAGSATGSLNLNGQVGTTGEIFPGAYDRSLISTATGRLVRPRSIFTGLARLSYLEAGAPRSPVLDDAIESLYRPATPTSESLAESPQSAGQLTLGGTARFAPSEIWTHTIVAGMDGARLRGIPDDQLPLPPSVLASTAEARGTSYRYSLRASSEGRFSLGGNNSAALTFALEESRLHFSPALVAEEADLPDTEPPSEWLRASGAVMQGQVGLDDAVFLTGGMRFETNSGGAGTGPEISILPMFGATWVHEADPFTVKLRGAYGKGIRPPRTSARETSWSRGRTLLVADLEPEEQAGIEVGVDLFVGSGFSLRATRFDQTASSLIQRVGLLRRVDEVRNPNPRFAELRYLLQNVGEISNRGWEVQAGARAGMLGLDAAWSQVDSRVVKIAAGYTGDLRTGDRPLEVPEQTLSGTVRFGTGPVNAAATLYRAFDWINYDRIALAEAYLGDDEDAYGGVVGRDLRGFWKEYPGVTHLDASLSYELSPGSSLLLSGRNLLDHQLGEPDNITVLPGRTISAGLHLSF